MQLVQINGIPGNDRLQKRRSYRLLIKKDYGIITIITSFLCSARMAVHGYARVAGRNASFSLDCSIKRTITTPPINSVFK